MIPLAAEVQVEGGVWRLSLCGVRGRGATQLKGSGTMMCDGVLS